MHRQANVPDCLPGFEKIHRYIDASDGDAVAKLRPGEFYVTQTNERVATVLGSCIAACVRDRRTGIGGMNHFLLPADEASGAGLDLARVRYGNFAMEALINGILRMGSAHNNLEIKLFGGARMIEGLSDVGARNIEFVRAYLKAEHLDVESEDLGGDQARLVHYWPATGKVRMKLLRSNAELASAETRHREAISAQPETGDIELF